MKVSSDGKFSSPRLETRTKETTAALFCESAGMLWSDPKDGELCLYRWKEGESSLDDLSRSDVQLDGVRWA